MLLPLLMLASLQAGYTVESADSLCSRHLRECRQVDAWLPPAYDPALPRRHPVLYVNDGQLLHEMEFAALLDSMLAAGTMPPVVVIGIQAGRDRMREYGLSGRPNAQGMGGEAGAYARFMVEELVPEVRRRWRVHDGAATSAILGVSLGGLSAFDLAWHHPETFGTLGALSGSFWWRSDDSSNEARQRSRLAHALVRVGPVPPYLRFFLSAGSREEESDRDGDGTPDALDDVRDLAEELRGQGVAGWRLELAETDGEHTPAAWRAVFPRFIAFWVRGLEW